MTSGNGRRSTLARLGLSFAWFSPLACVAEEGARVADCAGGEIPSIECLAPEAVRFESDGVVLHGDWYRPEGDPPFPGVVLVHGAGPMDRRGPGAYLVDTAAYFVSRGYAVLSYDKRGTGQSLGNWRVMDFDDLARDVAAALRYVRRREDVASKPVGLWGISQAGWVLPLASQVEPPDFVISVSAAGTGMTPAEQNLYDVGNQAAAAGLDSTRARLVEAAWRALYAAVRARGGDPGDHPTDRVLDEALTDASGIRDGAGLLPPASGRIRWEEADQWFLALGLDFDAVPAWATMTAPVLAIYGGADRSTPTRRVLARFERDVVGAGVAAETHVIQGAGHLLLDGPLGEGRLLPEYERIMDVWLLAHVGPP